MSRVKYTCSRCGKVTRSSAFCGPDGWILNAHVWGFRHDFDPTDLCGCCADTLLAWFRFGKKQRPSRKVGDQ